MNVWDIPLDFNNFQERQTRVTLCSWGHCHDSSSQFSLERAGRRAKDRISRKRMHLEEKRDTMKLRRVDDRENGLANNFVSVSLVLSFITLLSRPSSFSLHLSCSSLHLSFHRLQVLSCLFSTRSLKRSVRAEIIRSWTAVTYVVHFVFKQRGNQWIVSISLKVRHRILPGTDDL